MEELGATLREARLRRNLSLEEVERETKVRQVFLAALEEERYDLLPARVFTQGFVHVYARYLGLDPRPLLRQLPPDASAERVPSPQVAGLSLGVVLVVVVAMVAIATLTGVCVSQRMATTGASSPVELTAGQVTAHPGNKIDEFLSNPLTAGWDMTRLV